MNAWWVSGFVPDVTWDLLGFIHQKSNFSICIKSCWIKWDKVEPSSPTLSWSLCRREDSGSTVSGPCFKEIFLDSDQRLSYLWCKISFCNFSHLSTNYTVHNIQEWENSGSAASGPCFKEILLDSAQSLSYLWCKISFCNFFIFPPTALFTAGSMCRSEHSDHQNVPSVFT